MLKRTAVQGGRLNVWLDQLVEKPENALLSFKRQKKDTTVNAMTWILNLDTHGCLLPEDGEGELKLYAMISSTIFSTGSSS